MMTIEEFGRRWRARELTSTQVTNDCLRCIEADNPRLNAFIAVLADEARRQAGEADREIAAGHDGNAEDRTPAASDPVTQIAEGKTADQDTEEARAEDETHGAAVDIEGAQDRGPLVRDGGAAKLWK